MGCVEVSDPTNSRACQTSFAKLYQEYYTTGICCSDVARLWITGYEIRIVDKNSKVNNEVKYLIPTIPISIFKYFLFEGIIEKFTLILLDFC